MLWSDLGYFFATIVMMLAVTAGADVLGVGEADQRAFTNTLILAATFTIVRAIRSRASMEGQTDG